MTTNISTVYMLQDNETGEFFSSFGYSDSIISIPVLFGAKEFETVEDINIFKSCYSSVLEHYDVVKRTSTVIIEKLEH